MKKDAPAGKSRQNIPGSSKKQIQIQPKVIPLITITDSQEGVSIRYAQSLITKNAVGQILQWIDDRTGRHYAYTPPVRQTPLLIFLPDVHHAETLSTYFTNQKLKQAHELVTEYLDKVNVNELNAVIVKEIEGNEIKAPPPLLGLHQELEKVKAYDKLRKMRWRKSHKDDDPEKRVRVLQEYLTTEKSMGDLKDIAGVTSVDGVNRIVHRNLNKIFEYLPSDVQQKYGGSANEAIKRKASTQAQLRSSAEDYIQNLSAGMSRRWEHYREVDKPQGKPPFSEQGLENIRRRGRNIPSEEMSKVAHRRWEKHREQQELNAPIHEPQQSPSHEEHTIIDFSKSPQDR